MSLETTPTHLLSTIDNPFNPHTHFKQWFVFDTAAGYNSSSLLSRVATVSDENSPSDQKLALELAIDEIVRLNVSGVHVKIDKNGLKIGSVGEESWA